MRFIHLPLIMQPNTVVDVGDLTPEQADNSITTIFGGITVSYCMIIGLMKYNAMQYWIKSNVHYMLPVCRMSQNAE